MLRTREHYEDKLVDQGFDVTFADVIQVLTEDELLQLVPQHDGWIIGDDPATARVLEAGKSGNLKACVKWGVGTDNVDVAAMQRLGLPWSNTPGMFGAEVADLAVGYVIGLARHLFEVDRATRAGEWIKPAGLSLKGKKVALVGYGDIGRHTAKRLQAFDMEITVYDPFLLSEHELDENMRAGVWPADVEHHDFVVLTCALTSQNVHMLDTQVLSRCKGIRVVNVARGPLIDETALEQALNNGQVAAVALDVFEVEPLSPNSRLRGRENTIFGSHNGSNTIDAVIKTNNRAIELMTQFIVHQS